ncbi:hypothetical protein [Pedobacter jeongneungensis]|uniref:hypothetical protein n=1 Tax=Pedobacter jeongneungensis TaxID=947309 RepID=UPI00046855AF|nr:hypothetical protein [Pedobacter jeongneungensis]
MKKLILAAAIAACFGLSDAKAQNVNGFKLSDIKAEYIEVKPIYDGGNTYIARIDYGQKIKRVRDLNVKDDDGNDLIFNSQMDCLNKLKDYGYELFNTYTDQIDKDGSRPVYVMKRK